MKVIIPDVNKISSGEINQDIELQLLLQTDITGELVNKIKKKYSFVVLFYKTEKKTNSLPLSIHSLLESNGKIGGFGDKVEAWAEGAQSQTPTTADVHGSLSDGEGVGGD